MTPNLLILADSPATFRELLSDTLRELLPGMTGQPATAGAPDGATSPLLTMREACAAFGISKTTLSDWKKRGIVPFIRLGRRVYFERERVLEAGRTHQRYQHNRKG
jgi:excisionase family DNA binding protein